MKALVTVWALTLGGPSHRLNHTCPIVLVLAYLMQAHPVLNAVRPVFGGKVQ